MIKSRCREIGWGRKAGRYSGEVCQVVEKPRGLADVSAVVIAYRPEEVHETVLHQLHRHRNCEVIFVNNGGGADISPDCPHIDTYIETRTNSGAYLARNIGSIYAQAPLVAFVDDDGIPDTRCIPAHLDGHRTYDIVASEGCCLPRTRTMWNYNAHHYHLGPRPCPYIINLEGNCCIDTDLFRRIGGWDDDLNFGGGGYDLTLRALEVIKDHRRFAYLPDAILYHDYTVGIEHMKRKAEIQRTSQAKHMENWGDKYTRNRRVWVAMIGREDLLIKRG